MSALLFLFAIFCSTLEKNAWFGGRARECARGRCGSWSWESITCAARDPPGAGAVSVALRIGDGDGGGALVHEGNANSRRKQDAEGDGKGGEDALVTS